MNLTTEEFGMLGSSGHRCKPLFENAVINHNGHFGTRPTRFTFFNHRSLIVFKWAKVAPFAHIYTATCWISTRCGVLINANLKIPAFVIVTEFGVPLSIIIKK